MSLVPKSSEGSTMVPQNFGTHLPNCVELHPKRPKSILIAILTSNPMEGYLPVSISHMLPFSGWTGKISYCRSLTRKIDNTRVVSLLLVATAAAWLSFCRVFVAFISTWFSSVEVCIGCVSVDTGGSLCSSAFPETPKRVSFLSYIHTYFHRNFSRQICSGKLPCRIPNSWYNSQKFKPVFSRYPV